MFDLKQHVIGSIHTIDHTLDQSFCFFVVVVFTVAVTVTNVETFYWSVKTNTKLFINKCYINASTADTFLIEFSEYTLLVLSSCDEILDNVCEEFAGELRENIVFLNCEFEAFSFEVLFERDTQAKIQKTPRLFFHIKFKMALFLWYDYS